MSGLYQERLQPRQDIRLLMSPFLSDVSEPYYDLTEFFELQTQCEDTLKITRDNNRLRMSSYNIVTDRWHIEQLRKKGDIRGLDMFRGELWNNQRTNLMERLHAVESYGEFTIADGQLYSKDFPEKPFGQIIKRGAVYRAQLGSPEQEREGDLGECGGWEYINCKMADENTPLGITILSLSLPGIVMDTAYGGKYVDKYTLAVNTQGRCVKRTRIAVDWEYDEYRTRALTLKEDFFDGYDGRQEDAWFLSHPILTDQNIFQESQKGMPSSQFSSIFNHPTLQRVIKQYEKNVFAETVDWFALAISFNAILNCADDLKNEAIGTKKSQNAGSFSVHEVAAMDGHAFHAAVYLMGARPVATVGGGGCPPNKGMTLNTGLAGSGGLSGDAEILSNSVAKFGITGSESCNKISCRRCNWEASDEEVTKVQEGKLTHCPKCGWRPK